jgi:50S ribosomal subunit-associated GTPase HflX
MRTDGLTPLKLKLRELERAGRVSVRVRVPLTDGSRLAELYREGEVLSREETPNGYELVVRLEPWLLERLKAGGLEVMIPRDEVLRRRVSG